MENQYDKYLDNLPEQIQTAVKHVNVPEKMRALAKDYKLHLDKWAILENEIMLALVGAKDASDMPQNISTAVGVDLETAKKMTDSIAINIFRPIREELQDEIENKEQRAIETLTKKDEQVAEPPSEAYHDTNLASSERKDIENDPYREKIE